MSAAASVKHHCRLCLGSGDVREQPDGLGYVGLCPVCDGAGEWDRPHICGVPVLIVPTADAATPIVRDGEVMAWRLTAHQLAEIAGPGAAEARS